MVAWNDAKGTTGGGGSRDIERISLKTDVKIRLIGELLPRYVYWTETKEGKKVPQDCIRFQRNTESFDDSLDDPFAEIDPETFKEKPQFAYVCNVIDRADGKIKIFDLKATIYKQIVAYAGNPDYGPPDDGINGYDLSIKKEKTGPLPQNVKYTVIPGRTNSVLTDEEKAMEQFNLSNIYKEADYTTQKRWLLENTNYFAGETSDEFKPSEGVDDLA